MPKFFQSVEIHNRILIITLLHEIKEGLYLTVMKLTMGFN